MSGHRIKELRTDRGFTLEKLSELSGVDIGTISALEVRNSSRSKYFPPLAEALGVSLDVLVSQTSAIGKSLGADDNAKSTHEALKKKLKDWRMHASPRSVQVIDQLTQMAERDSLREEDWTLIDQLAKRLRQTS
jgi:transcriptional regulator with XRE-family HTH domain